MSFIYDAVRVSALKSSKVFLDVFQVPDIDAIIAPVGSGGMVSGISVAAKGIKPGIKIFAAEPLQANKCAKSFVAGERILLSG